MSRTVDVKRTVSSIPRVSPDAICRFRVLTLPTAILLLMLVAVLPVQAQSPAPALTDNATPGPVSSPLSSAIPVPRIATRAELDTATLESLALGATADTVSTSIQQGLDTQRRDFEAAKHTTSLLLQSRPSLDALQLAERQWKTTAEQLTRWSVDLEQQATAVESALTEAGSLHLAWTETLVAARSSDAPPATLDRVREVIATAEASRLKIERHRQQILTLQSAVAERQGLVDAVLDEVASARQATMQMLLVRDAPPLWSVEWHARAQDNFTGRLMTAIHQASSTVGQYSADHPERLVVQIIVFAGLVLFLRFLSSRVRGIVETGPRVAKLIALFDAPIAMALLLACLTSPWVHGNVPGSVNAVIVVLAVTPTIIILRQVTDPEQYPLLYLLAGAVLLDRLRDVLTPVVLFERLLFLGEMLVCAFFLLWFFWWTRRLARLAGHRARAMGWIRAGAGLSLPIIVAALLAEVAGYGSLARLLWNGVLRSAYLAFVFFAALRIVEALVVIALRVRPLALSNAVSRHRARIQRLLRRVLQGTAILAWAWVTLDLFALQGTATWMGERALTTPLAVGSLRISLGTVMALPLTIWMSFQVSRGIRFILDEDVYPRTHLHRGLPYVISTLLHYVIVIVGIILGAAIMGFNMDRFTILAGAFGVGIGFGLQSVVNNFVSGLLLLFERPIKVGDIIQVGDLSGQVIHIGIRASIVRTWDRAAIVVPNGKLIADQVVNWTYADSVRGLEVMVGVSSSAPPDRVLEILRQAAAGVPGLSPQPPPQSLLVSFGDNATNYAVRVWVSNAEQWLSARSELATAVVNALADAAFDMPCPQRDLHLRSVDDRVASLLKGSPYPAPIGGAASTGNQQAPANLVGEAGSAE